MMSNERNYGTDLLRLVLMFMVCMLHTLGQGGILNACESGGLNYKVFWLLKILAYCAVDGFALISGYMAIDKPRKYNKLAEMWFQAFFYSFIVTLILTLFGLNSHWDKSDIIKCALPVTYNKFWYFTAFFALFFATPILNKFIFSLDDRLSKKAVLILAFLFSLMGVVGDPFKSQSGYSAIWLMVLYCIGALAKRIKLFETRKSISLIALWGLCIIVTWLEIVYLNIGRLTNYVSPTVLLSGMIMVVLFSRLKLKGNVIAKLSPLAFGIYLFQLNQVVWGTIIKDAFVFVAQKNTIIGVAYAFMFALIIFVSGMIVEFVRSKLFNFIRIPLISKKIVNVLDLCLDKFSILLK